MVRGAAKNHIFALIFGEGPPHHLVKIHRRISSEGAKDRAISIFLRIGIGFMYNATIPMIKFLRNKSTQKKIYFFLAIVIIPPFVLWGVMFSKDDKKKVPSSLGYIENQKVSLKDYLASYKAVQHELSFKYGERLKEIAPLINMKGEAWDRLLLLHYAKQQKIKANDQEIVQWIMSQQALSNKGRFDERFYKMYVTEYLRISMRDFEEEVRQLLTINKVIEKVRGQINFTDAELKTLYRQENGQRDLAYGVVTWESLKDKVQATDEELQKVYPMVQNQLKDPTTGKMLTFDEVKEELRRLVIKQKSVELAIKKLDGVRPKMSGSSFEKALTDEGVEAKTFEKFRKGSALPEVGTSERVEAVVGDLKEGEISQGFPVPSGAAIIKVVKDWPGDDTGFEEGKVAFKEKMINKRYSVEMRKFIEDLRSKLKIDLETMRKLFAEDEPAAATKP